MTSMPITTEEMLDQYEKMIRADPKNAIRMVMWLTLYDQQSASWARDFLQQVGVLPAPKDEKERASQLRKVHRWRVQVEESVGLPTRRKRGASANYNKAVVEWKRLNRRPTKDDLLNGWIPQRLLPQNLSETKHGEVTPARLPVVEDPTQNAVAPAQIEERSPEKQRKFAALERIKKKVIPS